ncbi:MAG: Hsp20/alpha crystallin family protein [Candidatus Lokiarchaeota archaeon]|nr:Hsp20/alpha crystallin family protein [Candidatus Harpocratesius repetitus]
MANSHDEPFDLWHVFMHFIASFPEPSELSEINYDNHIDLHENNSLQEENEWFVEIFDDNDHITVVAEIPCIRKDEVDLFAISSTELEITKGNQRKTVNLPKPCEVDNAHASFRNGILEIIIPVKS